MLLLRQVNADRPFEAGYGKVDDAWSNVGRALRNAGVSAQTRTIHERFKLLLRKFRHDEMASLRKSGTDEEYGEREQLLTEISQLLENQQAESKEKKARGSSDAEAAKKLRDAAMLSLREKPKGGKRDKPESSTTEQTTTDVTEADTEETMERRNKKRSLLAVMADKEARRTAQLNFEKERLAFEKEKLRVKEKQLDLDSKFREEQFRAEQRQREEERKQLAEQFHSQMHFALELAKSVASK